MIHSEIITGLDIGTNQVCAMIGKKNEMMSWKFSVLA